MVLHTKPGEIRVFLFRQAAESIPLGLAGTPLETRRSDDGIKVTSWPDNNPDGGCGTGSALYLHCISR